MQALSKLAALAEKVPGFVRPASYCRVCGNQGGKCNCDEGYGIAWDDSPAALLMAVWVHCSRMEKSLGQVYVRDRSSHHTASCTDDKNPEAIARAALVALLRAHGVEVSG